MWVGLGGLNAPLAQVATISSCNAFGIAQYSAAYEMHGHPDWKGSSRKLANPDGSGYEVDPGDSMTGSVLYAGGGVYHLNLRNHTKGWHFSTVERGSSDKTAWDTALWIVEAPTRALGIVAPLANFGATRFTQCLTNFGPIRTPEHSKILKFELSEFQWPAGWNLHKARPSAIEGSSSPQGGEAFDVTWRMV
jgi:hypothetical protein